MYKGQIPRSARSHTGKGGVGEVGWGCGGGVAVGGDKARSIGDLACRDAAEGWVGRVAEGSGRLLHATALPLVGWFR